MLDFALRSVVGPVATAIPGDRGAAAPPSPLGLRALVGRLAGQGDAAREPADPAARRNAWLRLADAPDAPEDLVDPSLRAQAQAAFRTVDGAADRALDAAMAVMETEIAELRTAVRAYGEALKSIQTYAAEDAVRGLARAALRDRPQRLAFARPVPRLPADKAVPGRRRDV